MRLKEEYFREISDETLNVTDVQGLTMYPQILSDFGDEVETYWGRKWSANSCIGKLRMIMLHRPGKEFLSVGKPTPWPPHDSSLAAWRMTFKPDLDEMIEHHENLKKGYEDEGVEVVIRKPDPNDPPYQVKSIYTDDVSYSAVYGQIILRMYDWIRRGEEVPTFQTYAEIGCPVVGMIVGKGMIEGGPIDWLDEKHVIMAVHIIGGQVRANTCQPEVMRANESGFQQFAQIVKTQDPEVDVRIAPGYGGSRLWIASMIDRHTSVADPKYLDPCLVEWMKAEMDWKFIVPPDELSRLARGRKMGPGTGVCLGPMKIIVPTGKPETTKWFESIGVEVVEVEIPSLVGPLNTGSINCAHKAIIRDPEPKSY
jgi:N-dimethylarginine dimethylaminohydrolase